MKPIGPSQLWKKHLGDWGVNVYHGCEFGCLACYAPAQPGVAAQPFWNGKTQADWGRYFAAREGLIDALRQQLRTFTPTRAVKTSWGQGSRPGVFLIRCLPAAREGASGDTASS
jgi:hypothetical protein